MTLSELIAEVQALCGHTGDTVLITTARVIRWLNEAQDDILSVCPKHIDLETKHVTALTLADATWSYSFASVSPTVENIHQVFYLDGANSRELDYLDTETFDDKYPSPADLSDGVPKYWTRRVNTIEVYPVPTASEAGKYLRLNYTKKPTAFSSGSLTATCDMTDADQGLVYYGVSEAFAAIGGQAESASDYKQRYLAWRDDYEAQKDTTELKDDDILP